MYLVFLMQIIKLDTVRKMTFGIIKLGTVRNMTFDFIPAVTSDLMWQIQVEEKL